MGSIELFKIFIRVTENGSFIRAAETMGRPASTISTAIRQLENKLGTRLFHRTTRRVSLTSDGRAFYERCQAVVQDVEETENLFRQDSVFATGKIKVDVPSRLGSQVIIPALPDFFDRYPSITLELGSTDRKVNLAEEGIDCAVRVGELNDSGMIARRVGNLKFINVASPSYIASYGLPQSPEELNSHFVVAYVSPTTGRQERWEWTHRGATLKTDIRCQLAVNGAEAYIAACIAGLGIIQIPEYDVCDLLAQEKLCQIMPKFSASVLPVNILYPHRKHLSRPLQLFIAWLEPLLYQKMSLSPPVRADR